MSASYPPGQLLDLEVDFSGEPDPSTTAYPPPRVRGRWRRVLATSFILLGCLALGVGLGVLAGLSGDRDDVPAEETSPTEVAAPEGPSTETASGPAAATSTPASSAALTRRVARTAFERARESVEIGFLAGRRASQLAPAALEGAPAATSPVSPPTESGDATIESALLSPGVDEARGDEAEGAEDDEQGANAAGAAAASDEDDEDDEDDERRSTPTPDRWTDPSVDDVDYDFSVPFEERTDRSRERLLELEQGNPYDE